MIADGITSSSSLSLSPVPMISLVIAEKRFLLLPTLAKAVGYFLERRVFLHANRTVVL